MTASRLISVGAWVLKYSSACAKLAGIIFLRISGLMEISKIRKILDELCQTIGGDWLLVGGALLQLEINGNRATEDIDVALASRCELKSSPVVSVIQLDPIDQTISSELQEHAHQ
jgi:hypothetical protein